MALLELFKANGRTIAFWKPEGEFPEGVSPFTEMGRKALDKFARTCAHFLATGEFPQNDTKFKMLKGYSPLAEIKPDKQWRIFGYLAEFKKLFIVVDFVRKKQNKHKKGDLDRALDLINQHKKSIK